MAPVAVGPARQCRPRLEVFGDPPLAVAARGAHRGSDCLRVEFRADLPAAGHAGHGAPVFAAVPAPLPDTWRKTWLRPAPGPRRAGRVFPDRIRFQVRCSLCYLGLQRPSAVPIHQHGTASARLQAPSNSHFGFRSPATLALTPRCRINAAFPNLPERRIYAAAPSKMMNCWQAPHFYFTSLKGFARLACERAKQVAPVTWLQRPAAPRAQVDRVTM